MRQSTPETHLAVFMKVRDLLKALAKDGWVLKNQKGSHRQFTHPAKPGKATINGHPSDDVPPGTLKSIMKQVGWSEK
jgi:predicted RNA binding protein YcfA (HicA-like mRNA interferase family)